MRVDAAAQAQCRRNKVPKRSRESEEKGGKERTAMSALSDLHPPLAKPVPCRASRGAPDAHASAKGPNKAHAMPRPQSAALKPVGRRVDASTLTSCLSITHSKVRRVAARLARRRYRRGGHCGSTDMEGEHSSEGRGAAQGNRKGAGIEKDEGQGARAGLSTRSRGTRRAGRVAAGEARSATRGCTARW